MGSFKEFYLNESSEYLKQYLEKKHSDRVTKLYRSEDKWAKITKLKKGYMVALGLKDENPAPSYRTTYPHIKDLAEIRVEYWFKDKG